MFGGISFGGLGSGLDTAAIINALVGVERVPINAMEARKEAEQEKISEMGTLEGLVSSLRSKASDLSTFAGFLNYQVSNSNESIISVGASSTATAGSHSIVVESVLATDRWAFDGVADPDADLSASPGVVQFDYDGATYAFNVADPTASSLNDIAALINAGPNGGVTASVLQTGPAGGATSYQMVLTAPEGGTSKRISAISEDLSGLSIDPTGPDPSGVSQSINNISVGNNARALIDGLQFERESNDFSDVIDGVSLNILTADPAETVTFTVSPDREAIKMGVQEFVDAYNGVVEFINTQNTYSEEGGAGGVLFGDNILRTVQRSLSTALFNQTAAQIANDPEGFGTLRLIGIELQSTGTLTVNEATMDAKMDEDLDAFAELFVDSDGFDNGGLPLGDPNYYVDLTADTGLADDLMRELDRIVKGFVGPTGESIKGIFDTRRDTVNDAIRRLDRDIDNAEDRLAKYEQNLVDRFTHLETVMAQLNAQQAYLTQSLTQLQ